jgi:ankyrin repeat protein
MRIIKAKEILECLFRIDERNVVNIKDIDNFINSFKRETHDLSIQKWLDGALRKYIINDYPANKTTYHSTYLSPNAPDWLRSAVDRGEDLYKVDLDNYTQYGVGYLKDQVRLILDYFKSSDAPNRPEAILFNNALEKAKAWRNQKEKEERDRQDPEGTEEIARDGNMGWVKVNSKMSLDREGLEMHHCLRGHRYDSGCDYYSLRDKDNKPHFTFEIENKYLLQAKGYTNGPIEHQYRDMTLEFLNKHLKLKGVRDQGEQDLSKNLEAHWDEESKSVEDGAGKRILTEEELLREYAAGRMDGDDVIENATRLYDEYDETDWNAQDEEGMTLLLHAVKNTDYRLVNFLLDDHADYNHQDHDGENFFFYLVTVGRYYTDVLDYFIHNKEEQEYIDWEAKNKDGQTVVDVVLEKEEVDICYALKEIGADFTDAQDKYGRNVLQLMILEGDEDNVNDFCDEDTIDHQDKDGDTPLHTALRLKDPEDMFEILMKYNPDIEANNNKGETPLHIAVEYGHDDIIEYLRDKLGSKIEPYLDELIKIAKTKSYDDIAKDFEDYKYKLRDDKKQMRLF